MWYNAFVWTFQQHNWKGSQHKNRVIFSLVLSFTFWYPTYFVISFNFHYEKTKIIYENMGMIFFFFFSKTKLSKVINVVFIFTVFDVILIATWGHIVDTIEFKPKIVSISNISCSWFKEGKSLFLFNKSLKRNIPGSHPF